MSEERSFKRGDVVRLKSGGPEMTVAKVEDGFVNATWWSYHNHDFYNNCFSESVLVSVERYVTHDGELEKHNG